ncbi:alpha/beta hydrolase family protein [Mesorhizobium sp. NPDC059054]|uniref:alpha/beta hydrolase family protein n=1 Tax=Mesorhizobium sp. NPDC059054 TaxID=3346711 RepID=UPI0036B282EA
MHALLKRYAALIGATFIAAWPMSATASETVVTLENGIAGTLNLPDGAGKVPAVLMLHGFAGSRDEVASIYKREAEALAAKGIGSLRIDFRGFGESNGNAEDLTVDSQLEDALSSLSFLKGNEHIDPARLGVLGFSLGGGVAILTADREPGTVKSLVTWSSVGDFHKDMVGDVGQKAFDKAASKGVAVIDFGDHQLVLKKGFFDSLDRFPLAPAIARYRGAYLAIAGSDDFSGAYVEPFVASSAANPKEALVLPGENHIYHALSYFSSGVEPVIAKTADWFAKTL